MKKGDFFILAAALVLFAGWLSFKSEGTSAVIYVNGEEYKSVSLDKDARISVESEYGINTVVIKNGSVRVEDSDCPNKECEMNEISHSPESIVCLPNRLTVIIENKNKENEADVIL